MKQARNLVGIRVRWCYIQKTSRHEKNSIWRLQFKMAANNNRNDWKHLYNNDTTMKFGGFKGQLMLYPKIHLAIK